MEFKMKKLALASALLLSAGAVQAAESIQWDSATVTYQSVDLGDDVKLSGFGISGTKLINDSFFVAGSYSSVSDEMDIVGQKVDVGLDAQSVGVGYRYAMSSTTDFFSVLSYRDLKAKASFKGESVDNGDNGYGLDLGLRSLVLAQLELGGSLSYVAIGEEADTGFDINAMYHFTDQIAAGVGYGKADDVDTVSLTATMFF